MADGVTVTGLKELERAVDILPRTVQDALRAVAWQSSRRVMERAKSLVSVASGYTRDNIHIVEEPENNQFIVRAGTDRPRQIISLHRSRRSGRVHTQRVTLNMLPNWLEYGTRYMRARPFMRPAADAERDTYERNSLAAASTVVEKLGNF